MKKLLISIGILFSGCVARDGAVIIRKETLGNGHCSFETNTDFTSIHAPCFTYDIGDTIHFCKH